MKISRLNAPLSKVEVAINQIEEVAEWLAKNVPERVLANSEEIRGEEK